MSEKPILAFDCATPCASIALLAGGELRELRLPTNRHAAQLMSEIDRLMREASFGYSELGAMITTVGPGSFTGLRIGLAALHGMALASGVEVKILTTLQAMAWEVAARPTPPARFYTGLRAGKGEVYMQPFAMQDAMPVPAGEIFLCAEDEALAHAPYYGNLQPESDAQYIESPNASVLCRIAHQLPAQHLAEAVPLYIRPPDAALPAALPWLK